MCQMEMKMGWVKMMGWDVTSQVDGMEFIEVIENEDVNRWSRQIVMGLKNYMQRSGC